MQHEKRVAKSYRRELWLSILVYAILLVGSIRLGRPMAEGALRTAILVMPMAGFGLMIWAIARNLSRIDEYQRARMLEAFSIAAAITAGLSFTYGFLETAGFPKISMFAVWIVMGISWGLVNGVRGWLSR
ncbi:hypothetical protein Q4S45_08980 [Massilia sp. R2A-15]|uniref:hypothetical protein n=1 Tax=Massilia sp. R2A-15 TaxID=3064278 RepID=UPI00273333EB|nr:hypothetical protein [Massilia sp. R2A-15]WLI91233.1 hypothetical protein Q4S45_08980 [Massilia sp. R2A-15]